MAQESKGLPAFLRLTLITLIAGLALGGTYSLTEDLIEKQSRLAAERTRYAVFAGADTFTLSGSFDGAGLDWCYEAHKDGALAGYVAQKTIAGYGGEIELVVGVDAEMYLTGVSVGGANFSETPGLGAKAKDAKFLDQFTGKAVGAQAGVRVIRAGEAAGDDTVDAITSATITSRAVANGVNAVCAAIERVAYPDRAESAGASDADAHTGATSKSPSAGAEE